MNFKSTNRIIRALLSRFLCLSHIGLSIFVLYSVKKDLIYLIPLLGAIFLIIETIVILTCFKGKEPTAWFSPAFFIYVTTIVSCYWFLELENIKQRLTGQIRHDYRITSDDLRGDIVSSIKIIWSQVEIQMFFALIMLVRWMIPKSNLSPHGLSDLLFKYFAISCDMLDFLSILQDNVLVRYEHLVYWTFSIWTWSTFQFFIYVPLFEDQEKNQFNAYITNSLLSVFFLDLPYLGLRMAAIFGFGAHNYNSYFFATKNVVMILLQIIRIKATFSERKIREDKDAKGLKNRIGFDKEAAKLFEPDEIAKRNFFVEKMKITDWQDFSQQLSQKQEQDLEVQSVDTFKSNPNSIIKPRVPRTIETVKQNKRVAFQNSQNNSKESLDQIESETIQIEEEEEENGFEVGNLNKVLPTKVIYSTKNMQQQQKLNDPQVPATTSFKANLIKNKNRSENTEVPVNNYSQFELSGQRSNSSDTLSTRTQPTIRVKNLTNVPNSLIYDEQKHSDV